MKQDAANHWKMNDLGRALTKRLSEGSIGASALPPELARRLAMGVMESLWIWVKRYYPRGDIGRVTDETIAEVGGWPVEDSHWFVRTLVEKKLLDESKRYRLIVHDLSEHAEDHVRKTLERQGFTTFADNQPVRKDTPGRPKKKARRSGEDESAKISTTGNKGSPEIPPALPSRTEPNLAQPCLAEPSRAAPAPHAPSTPAELAANERLKRRRAEHGRGDSNGIGSVAAAVGRPDYPRIVRALSVYWPPPDPLAEDLAALPNASVERVFWAIETAEAKFKRGELRGQSEPGDKRGRKAVPGWIRKAIENGYEVPADWVEAKTAKLAGAGT